MRYLLVIGCLFVTSCMYVGQRLLTVEIDVDGTVEFTAMRGVRDDTPVADMWDALGGLEFDAMNPSGDSTATTQELAGTVTVRIKHVNNELTSAELSSLKLAQDASGMWRLGPGELDRIKAAAAQ